MCRTDQIVLEAEPGLQVSTKTSTVGPGYHAHIVEMFATLEQRWNWIGIGRQGMLTKPVL